jgi:hypothetical protein
MDQYNFRIVNAGYLDKRSYVCFYLDGKRMREYCGNNLQMNIFPNRAKNVREKNSLLKRLRAELIKAVKADKYPVVTSVSSSDSAVPDKVIGGDNFATEPLLDMALSRKLNSGLSFSYLRNLRGVVDKFRSFLSETELKADIRTLSTKRVQDFLDSFRSSGCHYMNKRRELGVILSMISMEIERPLLDDPENFNGKEKSKTSQHLRTGPVE